MSSTIPPRLVEVRYYEAAQAYLRSLPPEHFMEAVPQATQRKISVESLDLVHADLPEVQTFNELLVQYPVGRGKEIGRVVPDNMVVIHPEPIKADWSYDLPLQPVVPFWVLDYVSVHNKRKDYEDNFKHFEAGLKVPYYLVCYCDNHEFILYRHNGRKYESVRANRAGQSAIPELNLELALLDERVRYWYKGTLLLLPAELQRKLKETRQQLQDTKERIRQAEERIARAQEDERQAEEQARQHRQQKERALAKLRELGVELD